MAPIPCISMKDFDGHMPDRHSTNNFDGVPSFAESKRVDGSQRRKGILIPSGVVLLQLEEATMVPARRSMSHVAEKEVIMS